MRSFGLLLQQLQNPVITLTPGVVAVTQSADLIENPTPTRSSSPLSLGVVRFFHDNRSDRP